MRETCSVPFRDLSHEGQVKASALFGPQRQNGVRRRKRPPRPAGLSLLGEMGATSSLVGRYSVE